MPQFDDDDFVDYENNSEEEFVEDDLNDDDYTALYDTLPVLKEQLGDYNPDIKDIDLKEVLYHNYFVVDDALAEIKSKFKRKRETTPPPKKLSKLELLAQQRAKKKGLAGLVKDKPAGLADRPRGLASLVGKTPKVASAAKPTPSVEVPTRIARPIVKRQREEPKVPELEVPELPTLRTSTFPLKITNLAKTLFTKILFAETTNTKKRKLDDTTDSIYEVFSETNLETVDKVKANFKQPSPDDVVLQAQELASGVKNIKLEPKKAQSKKAPVSKPKKKIDMAKALREKLSKRSLSFAVIGHVDSGKSTLAGRLLYDLNIVDSKTLHKLTKESESIGKASFALAWIMDQTKDERERGVTVDICQTQFATGSAQFTMIDCPGHKSFIPQMINGISQADIALLIVDAGKGAFETSFGVGGQTREQITIAKHLGLERVIVAINKMDSVDWSLERYLEITKELSLFLVDELKFERSSLIFIPTSGLTGDNVVKGISGAKWPGIIDDTTLLSALEDTSFTQDKYNGEFIMTINDIETSSDVVLVSGRVNSGKLQPGESVCISPSADIGTVDRIYADIETPNKPRAKQDRDLIIAGEFATLRVKGLSLPDNVRVGDFVSKADKPIEATMKIKCKITTFKMKQPLLVGTQIILFRNNISVPATLSAIEGKNKKHLGSNQEAVVHIQLTERPIPVITHAQDSKLGRVVLRKHGETIGAGTVEELL